MERVCENCKQTYKTSKKDKRFCSRKCYATFISGVNHHRYKNGLSRGSKTNCLNCDLEIIRKSHNQKYCSTSCQLKYEYKNGLRDKIKITKRAQDARRKQGLEKFKTNPTIHINKGYKIIYIPGSGYKKYHHYIWEKSHPPLKPGYCLHHINGDKLDNRLKNLIMLTHHDHHKLHAAQRKTENANFK